MIRIRDCGVIGPSLGARAAPIDAEERAASFRRAGSSARGARGRRNGVLNDAHVRGEVPRVLESGHRGHGSLVGEHNSLRVACGREGAHPHTRRGCEKSGEHERRRLPLRRILAAISLFVQTRSAARARTPPADNHSNARGAKPRQKGVESDD